MVPERSEDPRPPGAWQRLQALFEAAQALPAADRAGFVDRACAGEPELRRQLNALLTAGSKGTEIIERAIGEAAARVVPGGDPSLPSGKTLGRYELVSPLGKGGMGHVYRARDSALEREVAIKLLNPATLASASGRRRFEREARATAALNHRNIVTIHDVGEDDGRPYIVMELVEGATLRFRLASGCGLDDCLAWAVQIAAALTAAHEAGIAHRDLKPENVIIDREGEAQIVDFGLARPDSAASLASEEDPTLTELTGAGLLMGTLGYMSPEAAAGESTDYRADQFALGAMLFEMVTGKRYLTGETARDLVMATLGSSPARHPDLAGVSAELRPILERSLAPDRRQRWERTSDLLAALQRVAARPDPPVRPGATLPKPRTELVGRDAEREWLRGLLVDRDVRLVTLTGPGGSGKTRLALAVAEDLRAEFEDRVYFVELGAIRDHELVLPAVAREVGAGSDRSPIEAVRAELAGNEGPSLVVLDNFEQVVSAARELGELLAKVESLRLLVTSREILRVYGEYDFPVEPLAYPQGGALPEVSELARYPAVALFVARARAAKAGFELDQENAPSVVELCARLDGLPLAIELAAARARTLNPRDMLARLAARKSLLTAGARDLPARQRTLRATIDWSYDLIDEEEKILLRRLGVFVGGFTAEAAEAVTNGYADLEIDILDGLTSLVDKSLVQVIDGPDGESRFTLLETIREFCVERLTEEEGSEKVSKAHAAFYVLVAEESGVELARGRPGRWLETIRAELDNCRSALDWLTANGEAEWGLRLALGLFDVWDRTGRVMEGQLHYERLLALPASHELTKLRARGLFSAAAFAAARGCYDKAIGFQEEALELNRELGDVRGQAVTLNALGIEASERRRSAGANVSDLGKAREAFSEALELWQELGDELGYARTLSNLASISKDEGELAEASSMYHRAGEILSRHGDVTGAAWAVNYQADVAVADGDLDRAIQLYRSALARFEELEYPWGIATTLADLAAALARTGDREDATRLEQRSLEIFAELDHKRGLARVLESLAAEALERDRPEEGLTMIASAGTLRDRLGVPFSGEERAAVEGLIDALTAAAGKEGAKSAWNDGLTRPVGDVVRLALEL